MRLLIFGTGRVGNSFAHYASHLGIKTTVATHAMAEDDKAPVTDMIRDADVVAAAIPDDRLYAWREKFIAEIGKRPAIHFSGALTIPGLRGYHPLYSFPEKPLPPEIMAGIAIAREEGAAPFSQILPGAANPEIVVRADDRVLNGDLRLQRQLVEHFVHLALTETDDKGEYVVWLEPVSEADYAASAKI